MNNKEEKMMKEINKLSEIPNFKNEEEEAIFWDNHGLGDDLLESMTSFDIEENIEAEILTKLRLLSMDKKRQVLDFTESLCQKMS
ncbi:hypothetical protein GM3708_2325 [Geminocystis sp. NIES-3708]|uniref:hypothetical protein n=1 Tax=Geminocystis sp. NIES-3708 TaxID=1615909 RepID=UPI0005FC40C4|nr:hypothetical protein [Geminocystis sp. NIES-3708]BAQ61919.1 hypothetical protein GM3708_2325 [Geminocystis sp. NIES-3708]